jgi:hypothetical protein
MPRSSSTPVVEMLGVTLHSPHATSGTAGQASRTGARQSIGKIKNGRT